MKIDALKKAGCNEVYSEKVSGKKANRPKLDSLLEILREGDTLVCLFSGSSGKNFKTVD